MPDVPRLLLVIPCYNEQEILPHTHSILKQYLIDTIALGLIDPCSAICYVDDGSRDHSWAMIEALARHDDEAVIGVKLSRNFGHQNALMAGLEQHVNDFDCFISLDADLQDDVQAMTAMLEKYRQGARIVYGVRNDRTTDSWFKRTTAEGFYHIMQKMGVQVVFNHADFRLMDQRVLRELGNFGEVNLFLRGIVPLIGFKSERVFYRRQERQAGESKYPLHKMILFAWDGITSSSTYPMRLVLYFGLFNFVVAMAIMFYTLTVYLIGYSVPGWTSTMIPITFFNGFNMVALGLIGEYIGKIYQEVKGRPRYIVDKIVHE